MEKITEYIEGGIYTNYRNIPAIYCGIYEDSCGEKRPTFIEINNCTFQTHDDIIKHIRKVGTKNINDTLILAPVANTGYDHGYMGQVPKTLYTRIDKRVKAWSKLPFAKN